MKTSIDKMCGRCIRRPLVVVLKDVQFDMEGQYSRHGFRVRIPQRVPTKISKAETQVLGAF